MKNTKTFQTVNIFQTANIHRIQAKMRATRTKDIVEALREIDPQYIVVDNHTNMGTHTVPSIHKAASDIIEKEHETLVAFEKSMSDILPLLKTTENNIIDFHEQLLNTLQVKIMDEIGIPMEIRAELNKWISEIDVMQEYMAYMLRK